MVIYEDDIFKDIQNVIYLNTYILLMLGVVVIFLNLSVFDLFFLLIWFVSSVSYIASHLI